MTITF